MKALRSIRLLISRAIAPSCVSEETPADIAADRKAAAARYAAAVATTAHHSATGNLLDNQHEKLVGHISTEDLSDFSSEYGRNAIISLGTWSAIARGFSEFVRNPKSEKLDAILGEFHCWNALASESAQMDDDQTLAVVARLSVVKPKKGNEQTDAIIARITHKSLEEVAADRLKKAEKQTKQREDAILGFNSALWASPQGDGVATMPAQKAFDKLQQTMLWVAEWDGEADRIAAELLLLESDLKMVNQVAKKEAGEAHDFEEGVMAADTLSRMYG